MASVEGDPGQIGHAHVDVLADRLRTDAHHETHVRGTGRQDAQVGVLEHRTHARLESEQVRAGQVGLGCGLARGHVVGRHQDAGCGQAGGQQSGSGHLARA